VFNRCVVMSEAKSYRTTRLVYGTTRMHDGTNPGSQWDVVGSKAVLKRLCQHHRDCIIVVTTQQSNTLKQNRGDGNLHCSLVCIVGEVPEVVGVQAESVAQLVSARTVAAADRALAGLRGGVGEAITAIRSDLISLLAALEVT
jgi:hypothetical protein